MIKKRTKEGRNAKMWRARAGLLSYQLAVKAKVSHATINNLEMCGSSTLVTLRRIAKVYGITTGELISPPPLEIVK